MKGKKRSSVKQNRIEREISITPPPLHTTPLALVLIIKKISDN